MVLPWESVVCLPYVNADTGYPLSAKLARARARAKGRMACVAVVRLAYLTGSEWSYSGVTNALTGCWRWQGSSFESLRMSGFTFRSW